MKINRDSAEFHEGMVASTKGAVASDNPYTGWLQRKQAQEWLAGFMEPKLRAAPPVIREKPKQVDLEEILPEESRGVLRGAMVGYTKRRR